jgi:hypothetical protein
MPVRRGTALGACLLLAGCVATAEVRDTSAEAAAGPPPPPPAHKTAGQLVAPRHAPGAPPDTAPDRPPATIPPGKVWVSGDWHWDGVRYVWVPGHLEDAHPAYTWR